MSFWSTVGGLVGGFFGGPLGAAAGSALGGSVDDRKDRKRADAIRAQDVALQKEFAQHGVQWRVADAAAAGVHPLFALGAGGAAYSPSAVTVGGGRDRGADYAEALRQRESADVARVMAAASSERDFAQAAYYRALAAKEHQAGGQRSDVVVGAYRDVAKGLESHPLYQDALKLEPDPMVSRSSVFKGETAGRDHPSMRQFELPGGFRVLLPAVSGGGVPEDIDVAMIPLVIGANVERFGARWINDLLGYATGRSPDARRGKTLESWIRGLKSRAVLRGPTVSGKIRR